MKRSNRAKHIPHQVPKGHAQWLETIIRAAKFGHLCVLRGKVRRTGEWATILCAVAHNNGQYDIAPLAHLPDENPYEYFDSCIEATP